MNVSAPGSKVEFTVTGLPRGTGYLVELAASSTDGNTHCDGHSPFSITAGNSAGLKRIVSA